MRRWCLAGALLADDPGVWRAWWRKWDAAHFVQLRRWAYRGFRPRIIYDIGAYQGLWSEMCQTIFAPEQCVLFEPQPEVRAIAAGRQPRIGGKWEIIPVALGDRCEAHAFHFTKNTAASSLLTPLSGGAGMTDLNPVGEGNVPVAPLDEIVRERGLPKPDLVKIDVQGFEGRVLAGGKETIPQAQRMVIEVSLQPLYAGQSLMPEILQTVTQWGFNLEDVHETFRVWPGRLWQVDLWLSRAP